MQRNRRVVCIHCVTKIVAKSFQVNQHLEKTACKSKTTSDVHEQVAVKWGYSILHQPFAAAVAATVEGIGGGGAALSVPSDATLRLLVNATSSGHGLSFETTSALMNSASAVARALPLLPNTGVGSPDIVQRDVLESASFVVKYRLAPLIADAIKFKLPVAVGCDESNDFAEGRRPGVLFQFSTPLMHNPVYLEYSYLNRSATNITVRDELRKALTQPVLLTEAQFDTLLAEKKVWFGGDHASYMQSAVCKLGMSFSGDAAHAIDTVLGVIAKNMKIGPVVSLFRHLYKMLSYKHARLIPAFDVEPVEKEPIVTLLASRTRRRNMNRAMRRAVIITMLHTSWLNNASSDCVDRKQKRSVPAMFSSSSSSSSSAGVAAPSNKKRVRAAECTDV